MSRPQTIQIFLPQGDPSGIRQAEITTRTVRVFEVPRAQVGTFLQTPEANQVGLYFLFGTQDENAPDCYIGQSGNVGRRLGQHLAAKDFWERALVAVSLTNSWTDTHVGFMEWKAIQMAAVSGRYALLNANSASNRHTPLPLESDCHEYLETISTLLATLGKPVLQPLQRVSAIPDRDEVAHQPPVVPSTGSGERTSELRLQLRQRGCVAEGVLSSEGLIVLGGSQGNAVSRPGIPAGIERIRERLIDQGIASKVDDIFVMNRDHLFSSPSYAAGALVGSAQNGRTAWRDATGRTLREIEQLQFIDDREATD